MTPAGGRAIAPVDFPPPVGRKVLRFVQTSLTILATPPAAAPSPDAAQSPERVAGRPVTSSPHGHRARLETLPVNAIDIAAYVVAQSLRQRRPVTPLRLHTLLYYVQVRHVTERQFAPLPIEFAAWSSGPVAVALVPLLRGVDVVRLEHLAATDPGASLPGFVKAVIGEVLDETRRFADDMLRGWADMKPWLRARARAREGGWDETALASPSEDGDDAGMPRITPDDFRGPEVVVDL